MENSKSSLIERLNESNNVLVTVSANPSVDQLAGAIGITVLLNKLGKHATAVFSGDVPSTIEFLKPDETIEDNTDSLRDFIIALDKSKADKLRYKVEDKQVKIFITPYHTSINEDDLIFSQGDFNVDVVLALGVHEQADLDHAITSHGRILHDATVATLNTKAPGTIGTIDWVNPKASSLCEMLVELAEGLNKEALDNQIATALLTGIVAETKRFSNEKTTPTTMSVSARLMNAGANQQLVATKLQESREAPKQPPADNKPPQAEDDSDDDGSLSIDHADDLPPIHIDEDGRIKSLPEENQSEVTKDAPEPEPETPKPAEAPTKPAPTEPPKESDHSPKPKSNRKPGSNKFVTEPPALGGTLSAAGAASKADSSPSPLNLPPVDMPMLSHDSGPAKADEPETPKPKASAKSEPVEPDKAASPDKITLEEIEASVESPHIKHDEPSDEVKASEPPAKIMDDDLEAARKAVEEAALSSPDNALPKPDAALGATGDMKLSHDDEKPAVNLPPTENENYFDVTKIDEQTGAPKDQPTPPASNPQVSNPTAPPPVPPPMMPLNFPSPDEQQ